MTRITVNVGFREGYYVSETNHAITKSLSALSCCASESWSSPCRGGRLAKRSR